MSHTIRAEEAGARVWEFVYGLLTDPARLLYGLDKLLESESQTSVVNEEGVWVKRLSHTDRKQERLLNLQLEGEITVAQFRAMSAELKEARITIQSQIEADRSQRARLEDLKWDKDALISHYVSLMPQGLTDLSPEERNRVYKMMRLRGLADREGTLTAEWGCNVSTTPPGSFRTRGR